MELEDITHGMHVKVLSAGGGLRSFQKSYLNRIGTVVSIDYKELTLTVLLRFDDGTRDWGCHKDVEVVEDAT